MSNTERSFGWAVVGTGRFADSFFVPALKQAKNTRLVAVYDIDKERAAAFAAKHQAARNYDNLDRLFADPEVQMVYISTPNNLHAAHTVQAAGAKKHVLCEKPMAISVQECESMIKACRDNRVKLGVDLQCRHHPAHEEAKRLIDSGAAGEITLATAQYSQPGGYTAANMPAWRLDPAAAGGGVIIGMAIHCLDLLRFMIGKEVEEVRAISDEKWTGQPVDSAIFVMLKFKDGPFANVMSSSHVRAACNDLVIYGSKARITGVNTIGMPLKGKLLVDGDTFNLDMEYPSQKIDAWGRPVTIYDPITGNYVRQVEAFNQSIAENAEPSASGYDGMQMVKVINAIRESAKSGKAVRLTD